MQHALGHFSAVQLQFSEQAFATFSTGGPLLNFGKLLRVASIFIG